MHFKPTETFHPISDPLQVVVKNDNMADCFSFHVTFQYTHFSSCHPPGVKKGFIKGEALRLLRTNSSETTFKTAVSNFKTYLKERGFPETFISTTLAEIRFEDRKLALQQRRKQNLQILPFVTQYCPSVPNLKQILMQKCI